MRTQWRYRTGRGNGPYSGVKTSGRRLKLIEDVRKIRNLLNFRFNKVSKKMEVPVRRKREETRVKLSLSMELNRRGKRESREVEKIQGSIQKRIELPQPKDNLVKGKNGGNTWTILFQGLRRGECLTLAAVQKLPGCPNLLRITAAHWNWCSEEYCQSHLPNNAQF